MSAGKEESVDFLVHTDGAGQIDPLPFAVGGCLRRRLTLLVGISRKVDATRVQNPPRVVIQFSEGEANIENIFLAKLGVFVEHWDYRALFCAKYTKKKKFLSNVLIAFNSSGFTHLQVTNELRFHIFVDCFAAVKCVLLGQRAIKGASDAMWRELHHDVRHGKVLVEIAEMEASAQGLGRFDRGKWYW
jgi:hypothetical protein